MSTLKQKAEQILQEKEEKIIPENFGENLEIFDVTGGIKDLSDAREVFTKITLGAENLDMTSQSGNMLIKNIELDYNINDKVILSKSSPIAHIVTKEAIAEAIDLTADKLKKGETILGIDGTVTPGIDTSDATATEGDILFGKTAYIDGAEVTGKIPTYDYSLDTGAIEVNNITDDSSMGVLNAIVNINSCAYENGVFVELETDMPTVIQYNQIVDEVGLTPEILKRGETVLGITGTLDEGIDTSDATAEADDLAMGKTAYVNGQEIIGSVPVYEENTYDEMSSTVGSLAGDTLEIVGTMGSHSGDTVLLRQSAGVKLTPLQSDIATAVGLTADKIKIGETILGIRGTYSGGGTVPVTIPIDYNTQEFVLYCGAIADILDTKLSAEQKSAWKCCNTNSGLSSCCIKLGDLSRSDSSSYDGFMDGIIGIAINGDAETMALVDVAEEWTASICTIDTQSGSSYYSDDMTYNDLIALLRQIGTVELQADGDIYFELYNNFSYICCRDLQSSGVERINTNQLYLEVRDI